MLLELVVLAMLWLLLLLAVLVLVEALLWWWLLNTGGVCARVMVGVSRMGMGVGVEVVSLLWSRLSLLVAHIVVSES